MAKKEKNSKKEKKSKNYLDLIPYTNEKYSWNQDEEGNVTIYVENKGVFHRMAQLLLKKPKVSQVHLEGMGNYIYPLLDGTRTVYEIGMLVREHFGEKAEPLFERLVTYLRTLQSYDFIRMK